MRFKLGKRPARPGAIKLKFGTFFDAKALPVPPKVFGHESIGKPWGMLANDQVSNCVFAGAAHESMVWARSGGRASQDNHDHLGGNPRRPQRTGLSNRRGRAHHLGTMPS